MQSEWLHAKANQTPEEITSNTAPTQVLSANGTNYITPVWIHTWSQMEAICQKLVQDDDDDDNNNNNNNMSKDWNNTRQQNIVDG